LYSGDERVSATNDTVEARSVRVLRQRLIDASQQPTRCSRARPGRHPHRRGIHGEEIRNSRQTVTTVRSPHDPSTPVITPRASRPHA